MAKGSLPMIEDCRHWTWATTDGPGGEAKVRFRQSTLFQEFPYPVIQGACANGEPVILNAAKGIRRHDGPYTRVPSARRCCVYNACARLAL